MFFKDNMTDRNVPGGHESIRKTTTRVSVIHSVCVCEGERNAVLKEPLYKLQHVTISLRTTNMPCVCVCVNSQTLTLTSFYGSSVYFENQSR